MPPCGGALAVAVEVAEVTVVVTISVTVLVMVAMLRSDIRLAAPSGSRRDRWRQCNAPMR